MNPYFLIISCAFLFAGQAVFFKIFSSGYFRGLNTYFLNNIFFLGTVVIVCALVNGPAGAVNPETYIYAAIFGVLFVFTILFFITAMTMGPTGLVTLFFSFGIIIPIIVDLTYLGTLINIFQIVGLVLLFTSFYIGNRPAREEKKGISVRFITVCIASMILNGAVMAIAKLHQGVMPGTDVHIFAVFSFSVGTLTSAVLFIIFHIRQARKEKVSYGYMLKTPKYYVSAIGSGVTTAFGNILMLTIAGLVPAAVQFPLMNGGTSLITAVLSVFIFKEKFTKKTAIVFVFGIAALVIINLY